MTRYVALLRAINVGGHNVIKMADLRTLIESLGCKNVSTYIQSGNVLFDSTAKPDTIRKKIEKALREFFSKEVRIVLLPKSEIDVIALTDPFDGLDITDTKLYVTFLCESPEDKIELPLVSKNNDAEIIAVDDKVLFSISRNVNGAYGNPHSLIETKWKTLGTTRNWDVVRKIAAL